MKWNYKELIPGEFADDSRVWTYQSSRMFSMQEVLQVEDMLNSFVRGWQSHGTPVKGYGNVFFGQFVVLMADERATGVSGCSTDSSVRLIKQIEQVFGVNMFDRTALAFVVKDKVELLPLAQVQYALDNRFITGDTLYFNNTVQNKLELAHNWLIPLRESWLKNRVNMDFVDH